MNALLRLTTNLLNFERADTYSSNLHVAEYELNTYIEETIHVFKAYADVKRIALTYEKNFQYLNVWLDKDKMDSILKISYRMPLNTHQKEAAYKSALPTTTTRGASK